MCQSCLKTPPPLSAEYYCVACRTPFENPFPLDEEGRCRLCRAGLRGFDAAYSFTAYEGRVRELIHLLKYSRMKPLAAPLGAMMMGALPRDRQVDLIVPMPLHWLRRWQRGFNQAELLAREISRRTGIRMARAVRRTRRTQAQAGLSNARRRDNVAGAFRASRRLVEGRRVLLVDDVMTTGATATACAFALKRAGARRVELLTLARADRRMAFAPATVEAS